MNTLDYPALEFEMTHLKTPGFRKFLGHLLVRISVRDIKETLAPAMDFDPVHLAQHARDVLNYQSPIALRWMQLAREQVEDFEERWAKGQPDRATVLQAKGTRLMTERRFQDARDEFERVLEIDPTYDDAHLNIGVCHEFTENYALALDSYRAELEVDPADENVPRMIARVCVITGRFRDALEATENVDWVSEEAPIHFYRGRAHEGLGEIPAALEAYREALDSDPDHERAGAALARLEGE